jgi:hypothetical protein
MKTLYVAATLFLIIAAVAAWRKLGRGGASSGGAVGEELAALIRQLRAANAQWPTIMSQLNPKSDATVSSMLNDLRGPHMFVPHTALNIIEDACMSALRANSRANIRDVLTNALGSMNKVTRYGD